MRATEQQHNERKREMMEKCFECYAENGLTGAGIKALAAACGCTTYDDYIVDLYVRPCVCALCYV